PLLDPRNCLSGVDQWPGWLSSRQCVELFGNFPLGSISGEEDAAPVIEIVGYNGAILEFKVECGCNEFPFNLEQLLREWDELFFGETAMPVIHGLRKRKRNARTDADQRRLLDAELPAIWSAVRKPMPRMSRAKRYGF